MLATLTKVTKFFVNLPLSSKYYHQQLPISIQKTLNLLQKEIELNEKVYLIEHISETLKSNPKLVLQQKQKHMINQQLSLWKTNSRDFLISTPQGRSTKIASVAWLLKDLNLLKKHSQLYQQIILRVLNDQWYVNFDQSVKALEAFTQIPDKQLRDEIYEKIERNVGITISDINMTYYQRICSSLLEAGRYESTLWDKVEQHIIRNLGMNYSANTLCNIFKAFAISKNGTQQFYEAFQIIVVNGHLLNRSFPIKLGLNPQFPTTGELFALLTKTYSVVKKSSSTDLKPDFKDYIYKKLKDKKTRYTELSAMTDVIKYLPDLQFHPQAQEQIISSILKNNIPQKFMKIEDIIHFYEAVKARYGSISQNLIYNVESLLAQDIRNKSIHLLKMLDVVDYLLENKIVYKEKQLIELVNESLSSNFKYLQPEDARIILRRLRRIPTLSATSSKSLLLPADTKTNFV